VAPKHGIPCFTGDPILYAGPYSFSHPRKNQLPGRALGAPSQLQPASEGIPPPATKVITVKRMVKRGSYRNDHQALKKGGKQRA